MILRRAAIDTESRLAEIQILMEISNKVHASVDTALHFRRVFVHKHN